MRRPAGQGDEQAVGTLETWMTALVARTAIEAGADPTELSVAAERALASERHSITAHFDVWELAMRATKLPGLPMRIARGATVERYGVFGYAIYVAPTLTDAILRGARFHDVINDSGRVRLELTQNQAVIVWDRPGPRTLGMRVGNEQVIGAMAALLEGYVGPMPMIEVSFRHPRPRDISEHEALFRAPLRFDAARDAIVLPRASLDLPKRGHDPVVETYFVQQLTDAADRVSRGQGFASTVSREILARLASGIPRADVIARAVGTSERTLRRRLAESGVTLVGLISALQRDRAEALLAEGVPVARVAFMVGFGDATAFGRAFRRWTGAPPSARVLDKPAPADPPK